MTKDNPSYFTPNNGKTISIRYVMFCDDSEQEEKQDILNYRTRKFAVDLDVEWYSETGLDDGTVGAIYLCHQDTDVVVKCAQDIVRFLSRMSYIKFLPE